MEDVIEFTLRSQGPEKAGLLMDDLVSRLRAAGLDVPQPVNTPYVNTIPPEAQPPYPGNRDLERRIKSLARWNAMAMVVNAQRDETEVGGHISSYASMATLYEVAYNHFFRGGDEAGPGRPGLFPGPHHAGQLRARLFGIPPGRTPSAQFPPRTGRGRRPFLLPASLFDARFLAVPDRLDGAGADHVHLSGPLRPLPQGARPAPDARRSRASGPSWATANPTSRKRSAR